MVDGSERREEEDNQGFGSPLARKFRMPPFSFQVEAVEVAPVRMLLVVAMEWAPVCLLSIETVE